jgi:hypothetical protein
MTGWVSIYRDLYSHEAFDNLLEASIFAYLIVKASYKPTIVFYRKRQIPLSRGQLAITQKDIGKGFKLTRMQVRSILTRLKDLNMITLETTKQITIITICKYSEYQHMQKKNNQQVNQQNNNITNNNNTIGKFSFSDFIDVKKLNPNYAIAVKDIKKGVRRTKADQKFLDDFLGRMSKAERSQYWADVGAGKRKDFDSELADIKKKRHKANFTK